MLVIINWFCNVGRGGINRHSVFVYVKQSRLWSSFIDGSCKHYMASLQVSSFRSFGPSPKTLYNGAGKTTAFENLQIYTILIYYVYLVPSQRSKIGASKAKKMRIMFQQKGNKIKQKIQVKSVPMAILAGTKGQQTMRSNLGTVAKLRQMFLIFFTVISIRNASLLLYF